MSTIWKSTKKGNYEKFAGATLHQAKNGLFGNAGSSWSRQQKLAMIACFAILGILLAVSACSKQTAKSALVSVSNPASNLQASAVVPQTPTPPTATATTAPAAKAAKKTSKKRPANVLYSDENSGVSFLYPRKFELATGEKAQPYFDRDAVPMNFVHAGGAAIATVELPKKLYPGTDFSSAFFTVNVNRSIPEEECKHFAYLDMSDADGEPIDAEKVAVGGTEMERTSEFAGNAMKQAEAQYYHSYENGGCYEYVLGLSTAGYGAKEGIQPVDRDEVFARLVKILATVKIQPAATEQTAQAVPAQQQEAMPAVAGADSGK